MDLGICQNCNERPAHHFRPVGTDPNRFTYGPMQRWCVECEQVERDRIDTMLTEARAHREV